MKYIIDVPEDMIDISGIRTLLAYADTTMAPYDESEAEQRGREEAWEFAQKILAPPNNSDALTVEDLGNCYGTDDAYDVVCGMTYQEARERYDAWQKPKYELQIGDEVMHDTCGRCVLLEKKDVYEAKLWSVIDEKGVVRQINKIHILRKTGRHFLEVADLLEKMRESKS